MARKSRGAWRTGKIVNQRIPRCRVDERVDTLIDHRNTCISKIRLAGSQGKATQIHDKDERFTERQRRPPSLLIWCTPSCHPERVSNSTRSLPATANHPQIPFKGARYPSLQGQVDGFQPEYTGFKGKICRIKGRELVITARGSRGEGRGDR